MIVSCGPAINQQPTQTAWIITATSLPTHTPTMTPSPAPTNTPYTSSNLGDGFKTIESSEMSIVLPQSYLVFTQDEWASGIENLEKLGGDYELMAQMIKNSPGDYLLIAYEGSLGQTGKSVSILKMEDQSLELYPFDTVIQMLASTYEDIGATIFEQSTCTKEGFECGYFYVEMTIADYTYRTLSYALYRGDSFYAISFQAPIDTFQDNFEEFETIFESIHINY